MSNSAVWVPTDYCNLSCYFCIKKSYHSSWSNSGLAVYNQLLQSSSIANNENISAVKIKMKLCWSIVLSLVFVGLAAAGPHALQEHLSRFLGEEVCHCYSILLLGPTIDIDACMCIIMLCAASYNNTRIIKLLINT